MDSGYKERLLRKYHELCDLFEDYITKGYDVHTVFLLDTLIPAWDGDDSPYLCGRRIATVYPDGSIGPCLRNHSFKTGTIFDPAPMSKLQCDTFHYGTDRPDLPEECRECESADACQGGCPYDRMLLTGKTAGKSVVCEIHQEIIPRLKNLEKIKRESKLQTAHTQ
jgi:uncharacterized protein